MSSRGLVHRTQSGLPGHRTSKLAQGSGNDYASDTAQFHTNPLPAEVEYSWKLRPQRPRIFGRPTRRSHTNTLMLATRGYRRDAQARRRRAIPQKLQTARKPRDLSATAIPLRAVSRFFPLLFPCSLSVFVAEPVLNLSLLLLDDLQGWKVASWLKRASALMSTPRAASSCGRSWPAS